MKYAEYELFLGYGKGNGHEEMIHGRLGNGAIRDHGLLFVMLGERQMAVRF